MVESDNYVLVSGDGVKLNITKDAIGQSNMLKGNILLL
jgi:hypothetical protein